MIYDHWSQFPMEQWRWPNFSPQELACKGTGRLSIDFEALDKLQALRTQLGRPLIITSAYRSPEHNENVGGARNSFHMLGKAFDVRMENHDPVLFVAAARSIGFTGIGLYPRSGFIHIDNRDVPYSWGDPFPRSSTGLNPEPPRQPERLAENGNAQTAGGIAVLSGVTAVVETVSREGGVLERLNEVNPMVLLIAAGAAYLFWREWKGR